MDLLEALRGGDLRSVGRAAEVAAWTNTPERFAQLAAMLEHTERLVVMRAADALEKVSAKHPEWLQSYGPVVLSLLNQAHLHIELKWHLAQLAERIQWSEEEAWLVSHQLASWLLDATESKITRANALQACFTLAQTHPAIQPVFQGNLYQLLQQSLPPSLQARLRKLHRIFI